MADDAVVVAATNFLATVIWEDSNVGRREHFFLWLRVRDEWEEVLLVALGECDG